MRTKGGDSPTVTLAVGALFMSLGIGGCLWLFDRSALHRASADWVRVPVVVEEVEEHSTSSSGTGSNMSSAAHWVEARYRYEVDGRTYTSTRVDTLDERSDAVGLHTRRARVLTEHRDSGEPFLALVDPDDPQRSALFRSEATFIVAVGAVVGSFALLGGAALVVGVVGVVRRRAG